MDIVLFILQYSLAILSGSLVGVKVEEKYIIVKICLIIILALISVLVGLVRGYL